jgi:histidinol phosphatase-like PHP family hydrolase/predicted nuclease with RNAse H fold/dephospho-CoA kinase
MRLHSKRSKTPGSMGKQALEPKEYFRLRDFEYVQPLYDLAFLLEVDALAKSSAIPQYRTFSLWRAAFSLDGYSSVIDRWLEGASSDEDLDYVPSARIRQYLNTVRATGTIPELSSYRSEKYSRSLRLRSVRGLGPSKIALTLSSRSLAQEWFSEAAINLTLNRDRLTELYYGTHSGPWQTAHVVPPLLRFLHRVQDCLGASLTWHLVGVDDPFEPLSSPVEVLTKDRAKGLDDAIAKALKKEKHFRRSSRSSEKVIEIRHRMGWNFAIHPARPGVTYFSITELAHLLDPFANPKNKRVVSDLHMHSSWSDGNASLNAMAHAVADSGLAYFAITDHSRSSKLQGGLTPLLWTRQAAALSLARSICPVLHGIEVDILGNGALDLPATILDATDIVVASVHSSWTNNPRTNTDRLLRAIESGSIDILAHPTSGLVGKPGVPDYVRPRAEVYWDEVFERCAQWRVALELNCFPSRLDLPLDLLRRAIDARCAISLGSDAHSRSHPINLRFGEAALKRMPAATVLNCLSFEEIQEWIRNVRLYRKTLAKTISSSGQSIFLFESDGHMRSLRFASTIRPPRGVPSGSRIVGIDLTAGDKPTGVALLDGFVTETSSVTKDEEILAYIHKHKPRIVSIDSPLGLPGGGHEIDPKAGIVRAAEQDLASIGIPAYPALIDSMRNLTLRGIRLRKAIEAIPEPPRVIESYPGAAQDILCIPRKQKGLDLLRDGLRRLGLTGKGLETRSHDEMDAITSALVGRYFESGMFEPMGLLSEAQLIVPKISSLEFDPNPIICLAGKTGAGKSVIARYLSVFYGFHWIRTRDLIRELLLEYVKESARSDLFSAVVNADSVTEANLREFGAFILNVHKQVPLRDKLENTIQQQTLPVVVDSIRDVVDVDSMRVRRPVVRWFVDCDDSIIRHRLATRGKLAEKRLTIPSPVDQSALLVRHVADTVIFNNGSLEELRWHVDDALFAMTTLATRKETEAT